MLETTSEFIMEQKLVYNTTVPDLVGIPAVFIFTDNFIAKLVGQDMVAYLTPHEHIKYN